jgi:hypothetical protein
MATADEKPDRVAELEHHSDNGAVKHHEKDGIVSGSGSPVVGEAGEPAVKGGTRGMQPPEFLRHMTLEQRLELETALKRKIDMRLMPMIILMYILNYIDRYVLSA